jgi:hypothetical protein
MKPSFKETHSKNMFLTNFKEIAYLDAIRDVIKSYECVCEIIVLKLV